MLQLNLVLQRFAFYTVHKSMFYKNYKTDKEYLDGDSIFLFRNKILEKIIFIKDRHINYMNI